jgi:6-phosphogluconolactonase (cycloisomerase 2 family)
LSRNIEAERLRRSRWLLVANEVSGNVVVFARDVESGLLTQTSAEQAGMPTCMCVVFVEQDTGGRAAAAAAL